MPPLIRAWSGVGAQNIAIPAATQVGDLMVRFGAGNDQTPSVPAGWNDIALLTGADVRIRAVWRIFQAGDVAPSFGLGGTNRGAHLSIYGHNPSNPIHTSGAGQTGGQSPGPSPTGTNNYTPDVADMLLLGMTGLAYNGTTTLVTSMSVLGGSGPAFTIQGWSPNNGAGNNTDVALAVHTGNSAPTPGVAIGARAWSYSAGGGEWRTWAGHIFGVRPAILQPIKMVV